MFLGLPSATRAYLSVTSLPDCGHTPPISEAPPLFNAEQIEFCQPFIGFFGSHTAYRNVGFHDYSIL